ncbi:uncharacterized protein K441DRAFT_661247 [Cenococcum geophilum 1.58]|uniref:uncharacterized protein n=1 Tax=Cenococcum geophilum 1.58 TaxID=794803 RepID=UPI00358FCE4C|nr:hypothetical protein K441DRAFT_661247 [Cenococcum geophilum 1.58]
MANRRFTSLQEGFGRSKSSSLHQGYSLPKRMAAGSKILRDLFLLPILLPITSLQKLIARPGERQLRRQFKVSKRATSYKDRTRSLSKALVAPRAPACFKSSQRPYYS